MRPRFCQPHKIATIGRYRRRQRRGWTDLGRLRRVKWGDRYHLSYTYDGDGNQTKMECDGKEVSLYYYDEEGRQTQATNPLGQVSRYTYDGDGERVQMEDPTGKTNFIYDGSEVLAELDATGTIKIAYNRLPGGRLISLRRAP